MIRKVLHLLGSGYGALLIVLAVIVCSIVGVVVPQQGSAAPIDLDSWRGMHPLLAGMIGPLGGFHIFGSRLFMTLLCLLAANIAACVAAHLADGTAARTRGETAGFVLLHVAVLLVISGGFVSAGWRFDGRIVLIEGQSWTEAHDSYMVMFEGPFRRHEHPGFDLTLDRIEQRYEGKDHQVELKSDLSFRSSEGEVKRQALKVNAPFAYRGLTFTQDQVGFAPRLAITRDGAPVMDTFVALKRFPTANGAEHRDILPVPVAGTSLIVTLFPSAVWAQGIARKSGEAPDDPVVKLEHGSPSSAATPVFLKLGSETSIAGYRIRFSDWRQWAMYRVGADPGYPLACGGLWAGLAALAIRYGRVLTAWWFEKNKP